MEKELNPLPQWPRSQFAEKLAGESGICELMDDLGEALTSGKDRFVMMGGGNPAHIPAMQKIWRQRVKELAQEGDGELDRVLADYDQPAGSPGFREAIAQYLNQEYEWNLRAENIGITNGGQTAFFFLLNRFGGRMRDGSSRKILIPLLPEYIGYGDQGVGAGELFDARRPRIEIIGERRFKYRVDFENLKLGPEHGAIVVSRPTNPSSNVLSDQEIDKLRIAARENGIPLIIDNAYGHPFPGVIFGEARPVWDDNVILTLSLSKLGLPGTRTGIVVAREDIIQEIRALTAIVGLANNNIGQAIARPFLESGEISQFSRELVMPFYRERAERALALAEEYLPQDLEWRVHQSEGAFFLWFWFPGLPVTSRELYRILREEGLIVVPGEYFFYGCDSGGGEEWRHSQECIRVSYSQPEEVLARGFQILGRTLRKVGQ